MEFNVAIFTVVGFSIIGTCACGTGKINDRCRTVDECRDFSYFCSVNYTCQCLRGVAIPDKYREKCLGVIDQRCKYDEHCIEGAYCQAQTVCKCKEPLFPSDDNTMCSGANVNYLTPLLLLPPLLLLHLGLG